MHVVEKMADENSDFILSPEISVLIKKYPGIFEVIKDKKRIKCNLTKHELVLSLDTLKGFIDGKKFQRLWRKVKSPETIVQKIDVKYKEFFVPSRSSKSRVYCKLTKKEVNNLPHELERYISGYKFMKAFYLHKQKLLLENNIKTEAPGDLVDNDENGDIKKENGGEEEEGEDIDVPFYALSEDELGEGFVKDQMHDGDEEEDEEIDDDLGEMTTKGNVNGDDFIVMMDDVILEEKVKQQTDLKNNKKRKSEGGGDNSEGKKKRNKHKKKKVI